jgi:putative ABC transport system substrate-binding protein
MRRREFILGGSASAWCFAAHAQQNERIRRVGVILPATSSDPAFQTWLGAFLQALAQLDWIIGQNIKVDVRWATPVVAEIRRHAAELAALAPDVILTGGTSTAGPMLEATRSVPIVFATVVDPVGAGFIDSLAKPGGNATGFLLYNYNLSGKWLDLLRQVAPSIKRVAVLRDASTPSGAGQFAAMQTVAPFLDLEIVPINLRDPARTGHRSFRTHSKRRTCTDGQQSVAFASRTCYIFSSAAQIARDLLRAVLRYFRRPDLIWGRSYCLIPARGKLR